jgi:hypothetical protein
MIIKEVKTIRTADIKNASKVEIKDNPCILFEKHNDEVVYFSYETAEERDRVLKIYQDKINNQ